MQHEYVFISLFSIVFFALSIIGIYFLYQIYQELCSLHSTFVQFILLDEVDEDLPVAQVSDDEANDYQEADWWKKGEKPPFYMENDDE